MYDIEEIEEMKKKAQAFAQKSLLVKESFDRWVQRTTDRAAYVEASRHGDEYRQKLQQQNSRRQVLQAPINGVNGDKKRRISSNGPVRLSPQKKRARMRLSAEYQPLRTDEELARRLKEVHINLSPISACIMVLMDFHVLFLSVFLHRTAKITNLDGHRDHSLMSSASMSEPSIH